MPTYVYRREDGTTFETQQRITEPSLQTCPTTGQKVSRVISGAGLIFKGEGFYLTDYARKGKDSGKEKSEGSESKGSDSKATESKTETKSTESASSKETKSAA